MKTPVALVYVLYACALSAQPIDCLKAKTQTERTICRTPTLLQADARMDALFSVAAGFSGMGSAAAMREDQRSFPGRREHCGTDVQCLLDLYQKQTQPYIKQIEHVRTFGPF